ncbi:MAG: hypothetical protein HY731_14975 [Candidatus Tectomicrobia bacterium]|nr:hypothetical protein [Candidatus Tectomicrobia bacterium]
MPYCYSCGTEKVRYQLTQCSKCGELICHDCLNEGNRCDNCSEFTQVEETELDDER